MMKYQHAAKLIRQVLLEFWDPLEIYPFNEDDFEDCESMPYDEYDCCIPQCYKFLVNHEKLNLEKYLLVEKGGCCFSSRDLISHKNTVDELIKLNIADN